MPRHNVSARSPRVMLISLGCAKNTIDGEQYLAELAEDGFELTVDALDADLLLVNTCGFIAPAREEAEAEIAGALSVKRENPRLKVVAMGCYAQRRGAELRKIFPGLDGVFGLNVAGVLAKKCRAVLDGKAPCCGWERRKTVPETARVVSTPESYAYLRLSDGCNNHCTYCAIPLIRGGVKSRPADMIVAEAQALRSQGFAELVVIAQDIAAYGSDRKESGALERVTERLLAETDFPRIRLLYAHPAHLRPELLRLIGAEKRLCGYLDLPLQHVNSRILKAMNRHYGREKIDEIYGWIAQYCPQIVLRSSAIVGFPGETDAEFAELLDFVRAGNLSRLGAFVYSAEADTPAATLPGQVPAEVAAARLDALMRAQQEVAFRLLDARVGQTAEILIDSFPDDHTAAGRSVSEAPEADGMIILSRLSPRQAAVLTPGSFAKVTLKRRDGYDLHAALCPAR